MPPQAPKNENLGTAHQVGKYCAPRPEACGPPGPRQCHSLVDSCCRRIASMLLPSTSIITAKKLQPTPTHLVEDVARGAQVPLLRKHRADAVGGEHVAVAALQHALVLGQRARKLFLRLLC